MLPTSNMESMAVATSDREADEIAAYTAQNLAKRGTTGTERPNIVAPRGRYWQGDLRALQI